MMVFMILLMAALVVFSLRLTAFLVRVAVMSFGVLMKAAVWVLIGLLLLGLAVTLFKLAPILILFFVLAAICRPDLFAKRA